MLPRFDPGASDGNSSIILEEISCSLIEPALDGEEEDMFDDLQGDLAGRENDLARNPR